MIIERIEELLPGIILDHHDFRGDLTVVVDRSRLLEFTRAIFAEGFQMLLDITAVDFLDRDPRFDVVYHFLNLNNQDRLRLKLRVNDGEAIPSLTSQFKCADWSEREVHDMFGLRFEGHPNLKRLLMWEDFPGHPLRKDFPMDGGDIYCNDTGASFAGDAKSLQA